MLRRKIYDDLLAWKNETNKMPLMIMGARQVGMTFIIEEFCKKEYDNYIEVNLFNRADIVDLYKERISSDEKFAKLKIYLNYDIEQENTILFIDEIQESEELISELKYFCEYHPHLNIICSGSYLGLKLKRLKSAYPVGKVKLLKLYSLSFEEFLLAFNEDMLIEEIKKCYKNNKALSEGLHNKALNYYKLYLCTGGMPKVVQDLVNADGDLTKYNKNILQEIIESYFLDMKKYVVNYSETLKINSTYDSIPSQLANESSKFQYSKINSQAKSRDYEIAINWLEDSNMILKSNLVSTPQIPLKGFVKDDIFKIYYNDVGILTSNLDLKYSDIISDNISLYKGNIAENYVACELNNKNQKLYYWKSEGEAEIDFLIYNEDGIIPIEVKASENTKSKSLSSYVKKYNPKYAIRISSKNFGFENNIKSIPLYAVFCLNL